FVNPFCRTQRIVAPAENYLGVIGSINQPRRKSEPSTPPDTPRARWPRRNWSSSPLSSQIPPHSGHSSIFTCSACCSFRSAPQRGHLLWWAFRSAFLRSASSFTRISWMISRFCLPKYSSSFLLGFSSVGIVAPGLLKKNISDDSMASRTELIKNGGPCYGNRL